MSAQIFPPTLRNTKFKACKGVPGIGAKYVYSHPVPTTAVSREPYLFICLPTHPPVQSFMFLSNHPSVHPPTTFYQHIPTHPPISTYNYLYLAIPMSMPISLSIFSPPTNPIYYIYFYLPIYPPIHTFCPQARTRL